MYEEKIGIVYKFFIDIKVALIKLNYELKIGDFVHFRNDKHDIDFEQKIKRIEIDRESVKSAVKGDEVGIEVDSPVMKKMVVLKVIE